MFRESATELAAGSSPGFPIEAAVPGEPAGRVVGFIGFVGFTVGFRIPGEPEQ
jgi:hypothetical protein